MRRSIVGLALSAAVVTVGASPAYAAAVSVSGARASNSGNRLYIHDTACDGYEAYTNWNYSTNNRLQAEGGCYLKTSVVVPSLRSFRACTDRTGRPDDCSSWVEP